MSELTPEQIAALPEEWKGLACDARNARESQKTYAASESPSIWHAYEVYRSDSMQAGEPKRLLTLLAALADATLRAEQAALQPGQVAVDETLLRMIVQQWADRCHCTSPCPLYDECDGAPDPSDDTNEDSDEWREATAEYCAGRLLQRFGLEVE